MSGRALVLLSAFLHALWNAWVKGSRDPLAFNVAMSAVTLVVGASSLPFFGLGTLPAGLWVVVGATAVVHAGYFLWLALAYERADLSLVSPISRSAPAFVALAAVPLPGESVSPLGAAGIAAVVVGMWLVQTAGVVRRHAFVQPGAGYAYLALATSVLYSLLDKRGMAILAGVPWNRWAPRSSASRATRSSSRRSGRRPSATSSPPARRASSSRSRSASGGSASARPAGG